MSLSINELNQVDGLEIDHRAQSLVGELRAIVNPLNEAALQELPQGGLITGSGDDGHLFESHTPINDESSLDVGLR